MDSFFQEALLVEPVGKAVDPVVGGQVLLVHAEAVAALCVHVELDGFVGSSPLFVAQEAVGREAEIIVGGGSDKHGRGVGRDSGVFESASRCVYRRDESGAAFWSVVDGDAHGDGSARGEADDADALGRNAPFGSMLANV